MNFINPNPSPDAGPRWVEWVVQAGIVAVVAACLVYAFAW
jgi:hypothetical protein